MLDTQTQELLESLRAQVNACLGPIAIGLDFAAREENWGLCVLALNEDLSQADLSLLLPQPRINSSGAISPTLLCRPSFDLLVQILGLIRHENRLVSLAVDVPFGWPLSQSIFLQDWSAEVGQTSASQVPSGSTFSLRFCDRQLTEHYRFIKPLAVGADRIALAARTWAEDRQRLEELSYTIDLGLEPIRTNMAFFECYPAAFVKLVASEFGNYKKLPVVRKRLCNELLTKYEIDLAQSNRDHLEWACHQKGSPDALDSFLCALSAWDHLKHRRDPDSVKLTTPSSLLERELTASELQTVRHEGWILVRSQ